MSHITCPNYYILFQYSVRVKTVPVNKEQCTVLVVLFPYFTLLCPDGTFWVVKTRGYFASWREYLCKTATVFGQCKIFSLGGWKSNGIEKMALSSSFFLSWQSSTNLASQEVQNNLFLLLSLAFCTSIPIALLHPLVHACGSTQIPVSFSETGAQDSPCFRVGLTC